MMRWRDSGSGDRARSRSTRELAGPDDTWSALRIKQLSS